MSDWVDRALTILAVIICFAPTNIITGIISGTLFVYFAARLSYFVSQHVKELRGNE